MNTLRKLGLIGAIGYSALTANLAAENIMPGNVPTAVRDYMAGTFNEHMTEIKECGPSLWPDLTLLYSVRIPSGVVNGGGWLVGYRLGREGSMPVDRALVIDSAGKEIYRFQEQMVGANAAVFQVGSDSWAVAMSWETTRHRDGYVRIFGLGGERRELLLYDSPLDEHWESMVYFLPYLPNQNSQVIAERKVLTRDGGVDRVLRIAFNWNPKTNHFDAGKTIDEPTFLQLRTQAIDAGGASMKQSGPIIEQKSERVPGLSPASTPHIALLENL